MNNKYKNQLIEKLDRIIKDAADSDVIEYEEGIELLNGTSEVLGWLKACEEVSMYQMAYDMARLAGCAGWVPDDFEEKANKHD